jgi:hypothetical protein
LLLILLFNETFYSFLSGGFVNKEMLDAMPAVEETQYVRHVRFDRPLRILMDGKKQEGAVLHPQE